ncbi:MAG: alcohol dehydrogenase catalytic domain-containing protein [Cyanobacteria bacterium HKST-UBA04]|nr:alcohol dehydrogenase catalytic domain-containing protein [Cyanobacteria bacterium HKST-UBA05]MCA9799065.1 alcohol dehydrogenase catalytic domain-containing protein [Cyanobacteria bacterium HKST-UBA04]MCA9841443.1 alcohol dehydrogenase catalytic domain-containing protein [Cyanobacteria bacterium HKST-UBA03]
MSSLVTSSHTATPTPNVPLHPAASQGSAPASASGGATAMAASAAPTMTGVAPTMKSVLFYQPGDIRYEDIPTPKPGPGELLIRVRRALTCGTDLKAFRRGHPVLLKNLPSPFGHECTGEVVALGQGVDRFELGERVMVANSAPCGDCFYCHHDQPNLCDQLDLLNGAYAEYLKVPARIVEKNTLRLPPDVSDEAAAFCEPLSVCLRGIELCQISAGKRVLIIGIGAIGLLMARLAKLNGAQVVVLGRNALKRELADTFAQADAVVDVSSGIDAEAIKAAYTPEGIGFDVVIEAVGQPHTWQAALAMVRRGGLVNCFGGCESGTSIELDTRRLHYDEITLISPFHHTPRHVRHALAMIASGQLDPTPLITHRRPLSQVRQALRDVAEGQAVKVALYPDALFEATFFDEGPQQPAAVEG